MQDVTTLLKCPACGEVASLGPAMPMPLYGATSRWTDGWAITGSGFAPVAIGCPRCGAPSAVGGWERWKSGPTAEIRRKHKKVESALAATPEQHRVVAEELELTDPHAAFDIRVRAWQLDNFGRRGDPGPEPRPPARLSETERANLETIARTCVDRPGALPLVLGAEAARELGDPRRAAELLDAARARLDPPGSLPPPPGVPLHLAEVIDRIAAWIEAGDGVVRPLGPS